MKRAEKITAVMFVLAFTAIGIIVGVTLGAGGDMAYLLSLQSLREGMGDWFTGLMTLITRIGESAAPVMVAAVLMWSFDKRAGERVLLINAVGCAVNQLLKITCCVYRPWIRDARITPAGDAIGSATGYSFPSGHTSNSGSLLMGTGLYIGERCGTKRAHAIAMSAMFVVWMLVGFSRNLLGVHTPQDVCVMVMLLIPIVFAACRAMDWADKSVRNELMLGGAVALMGVALLIYAMCKGYPVDYAADGSLLVDPQKMIRDTFSTSGMMVSFAVGFVCGRRLKLFDMAGGAIERILRSVLGIGVLLLESMFMEPALVATLGGQWGKFAGAAIFVLTVMVIWPAAIGLYQRIRKGAAGKAQAAA